MPRTLSQDEIIEFREQACAAASKLFAQRGTDGVTMRALAEVMGISPMKPYHYFRDKEEILVAAVIRAFNHFIAAVEGSSRAHGSPLEQAEAKRRAYVDFALAEPDAYRIMFEMPYPDLVKYPELAETVERARQAMRRSMDLLVSENIIAGDPSTLGYVFWCCLHGPVSLYLAGKLDSLAQLETLLELAMKGLLAGLKPAAV
ncbi:MAG: TetR/AcrR family transcriptional regulator [Rhizomicrobium sp.]|nr:TetR/AcrR family transcriptional regulator [Rhizomicrobium sp.]